MKKIIGIFIFLIVSFFNVLTVEANTSNINLIFSDYNVLKDQTVEITVNVDNILDLQSFQLVLELNQYFTVLEEEPCSTNNNSYFSNDEVYVNECLDQVIRFVCFKKNNIKNFNHLCTVKLKANMNLSNIQDYFQNIKISLFNKEYELISSNIRFSEGIKIEWLNEAYLLELSSSLPDFLKDIKILNRKDDEYLITLITDSIDTSKVLDTVVSVYIYDYTNNQTIYLSKSVRIVDLEKPSIKGDSIINIIDQNLTIDSFISFQVFDNYDHDLTIYHKFYDQDMKVIDSKEKFFQYLKNHTLGYIESYVEDFSGNQSEVLTQTVKISDTLAPVINCFDIEIKDVNLKDFNLLDYIEVIDQYDPSPSFYYLIENLEEDDLIKALESNYQVNLKLYASDIYLNSSFEYSMKITLIDTINPTIEKVKDLEIIDQSFTSLELALLEGYKTFDNFTLDLNKHYKFCFEEEVTKEVFLEGLYKGKIGKVLVWVSDSYNNLSNVIELKIEIIDQTAPVIIIDNIEENKKYLSIPSVSYQVSDNFSSPLTTTVLLDGEEYKNNTINMIGKHTIEIIVVDQANNKSVKVVNFEIIKNNLIGCGIDSSCYKDNYIDLIYLALLLLAVSVFIVIVRIALKRNKHRPKEF